MRFVFIFGPQAVGKMTVGEELARQTGMKLFHNHMSIEMVNPIFPYGTPEGKHLVKVIRRAVFETALESDQLEGLIFTYVWALDAPADWHEVMEIKALCERYKREFYCVELEADLEKRVERNRTPHRLEMKPTKRNLEWTEKDLLKTARKYRLNSLPKEIPFAHYLRINNTELSPEQAAGQIIEYFGWKK